jgi:hypothetical protein
VRTSQVVIAGRQQPEESLRRKKNLRFIGETSSDVLICKLLALLPRAWFFCRILIKTFVSIKSS